MNSPFFARPHAHGHFPSIALLPVPLHHFLLLLVTIHPATDPFHAQGNLQPPLVLLALLALRFQCGRQPPSLPHLHLRHVGGLPHLLRRWRRPPSVSRPRPVGASAINHGLSSSGGKRNDGGRGRRRAGARERRQRRARPPARSLTRSFATCDSAVRGQIAERKEERPRE